MLVRLIVLLVACWLADPALAATPDRADPGPGPGCAGAERSDAGCPYDGLPRPAAPEELDEENEVDEDALGHRRALDERGPLPERLSARDAPALRSADHQPELRPPRA